MIRQTQTDKAIHQKTQTRMQQIQQTWTQKWKQTRKEIQKTKRN